jgi:hypothetical protein
MNSWDGEAGSHHLLERWEGVSRLLALASVVTILSVCSKLGHFGPTPKKARLPSVKQQEKQGSGSGRSAVAEATLMMGRQGGCLSKGKKVTLRSIVA